ncbi:MAG: DUF4369 domain-containing protein [Rhizobacter sp.]|nr:DUF4369 domain-containing protein [Rhizobacter sp.]
MRRHPVTFFVATVVLPLLLVACWVGEATVGGTVSGLPTGASVVLQNNGTDNLTVSANGSFTFSKTVEGEKTYAVSVLTQPAGATCTVANGSGTIDADGTNVTNVAVTCVTSASLTGTVSGLLPGTAVTLSNAGVLLPVAVNGAFAFPGVMTAGTAYNVTVDPNGSPAGLTCNITNGSGTIVTGTPTAVVVTCS